MKLLLLQHLLLILLLSLVYLTSGDDHRQLPNALIIGAKKSGTRALLKFLGAHPNVSTAGAEVHFFDRHYHQGYDWYRDQMPEMAPHHTISIEKTPKYLVDRRTPARVKRLNARMKLIVVLRDPVTRAISEYVQGQTRKTSANNFKRSALDTSLNHSQIFASKLYRETKKRTRRHHDVLNDKFQLIKSLNDIKTVSYSSTTIRSLTINKTEPRKENSTEYEIRREWPVIRNGLYVQHVRHWLRHFPRDQMLFVHGERLISEPGGELERVQRFLGLEPLIKQRHFVYVHHDGRFPCIRRPLEEHVEVLGDEQEERPIEVRCLSEQKGRVHPHLDEKLLRDLRDFYRPYNEQLFELLGIEEPWW